ncbi:hypothetical protein REH81_14435, partial [Vibrio rotiferianus]
MSRKDNSKPVVLDDAFYEAPAATIEPIHLDEMKLKCNGATSHFIQLLYRGAPNYSSQGKKIEGVDYIPVAGREAFARDVYRFLKTDFNLTKRSHFNQVKLYLRWMDSNHLEPINGDYF